MKTHIFRRLAFLLVFVCGAYAGNGEGSPIFVQAGAGSFNHEAAKLMFGAHFGSLDIQFAGTPLDAMVKAAKENGLAFTAVSNTLVPGNLVQATVDAIKEYQIIEVKESITMKIEQCLLRHMRAIAEKTPLTQIASHPAALLQIAHWKSEKKLVEISEPLGTSKAADRLSRGEYSLETGVIGPKVAADVYKDLAVVVCGIQDNETNATTFGLLKVVRREEPITEPKAREELREAISSHAKKPKNEPGSETSWVSEIISTQIQGQTGSNHCHNNSQIPSP
jgi:prephenate dehydratase